MNYEKIARYGSWVTLYAYISVCVFYIVHNAQWLVGDDAIVICHTGFGLPFLPSDTVFPESGRFFPMAYQMYNILLLFFNGYISASVHYTYHAICFMLASIASFSLFLFLQRGEEGPWKYVISLLATIFIASRVYSGFLYCFSTTWFGFLTQTLTILLFILFVEKKKWIYGGLSFLLILYSTYGTEVGFVLPFAWGVCGLVLRGRNGWLGERAFYWTCVFNGIVFLLVYYFLIFSHIHEAYDAAHGEAVSLFANAIRILVAQKFLWVAILLFLVRVWKVIVYKDSISIYDILLLAAAAHCCGGFLLKLNWILYYNRAVIFALPAVIFYGTQYLRKNSATVVLLVYALFYLVKLPTCIEESQAKRKNTQEFSSAINTLIRNGETVYWYEPSTPSTDKTFDWIYRDWVKFSLQTLLRYDLEDPNYSLPVVDEHFCNINYVITNPQNDLIVNQSNIQISSNGECVSLQSERDLRLYKIK